MRDGDKSEDIRQWMEDVAQRRRPTRKLIFDKNQKKLVAVPVTDPRADDALEFTPQEARRFRNRRSKDVTD